MHEEGAGHGICVPSTLSPMSNGCNGGNGPLPPVFVGIHCRHNLQRPAPCKAPTPPVRYKYDWVAYRDADTNDTGYTDRRRLDHFRVSQQLFPLWNAAALRWILTHSSSLLCWNGSQTMAPVCSRSSSNRAGWRPSASGESPRRGLRAEFKQQRQLFSQLLQNHR